VVAVNVVPLPGPAGVEVLGLDLRASLSEPDQSTLRRHFDQDHLLCFRDQSLSIEDQIRLVSYLGTPLNESHDGAGFSFVSNVREHAIVPHGRLLFHSDYEFTPQQLDVISLYAISVPDAPAPTCFANMVRAAEQLSEAERARLAGLHALHIFDLFGDDSGNERYRAADLPPTAPRWRHPVVRPHARTGRPVLFVTQMETDSIVELDASESERTIEELFAVLYAPENVYEHHWRVDDLVVWDNLALQHGRPDLPETGERTLRRVSAGDPDWFAETMAEFARMAEAAAAPS
jgi:taurine dioxygenase